MIRIEQLTKVFGHGAEETLVLDRLDFSVEAREIFVPQLAPTQSAAEVISTVHQHQLWLSQVPEANSDFAETTAAPVFRWGFERAPLSTVLPGVAKATPSDIAANPEHLTFPLLDLDAAVGYIKYSLAAKIPVEKQISAPPTSPCRSSLPPIRR